MANEEKPNIGALIALKAKEKAAGKENIDEGMYAEMAKELLAAMDKKDAKVLGSHLKNFVKVCLKKNS